MHSFSVASVNVISACR